MHQQIIFVLIFFVSSNLLSASKEVDDCVGEFLSNKFQSFYFEPHLQQDSLHFSGSSFSINADVGISDLTITDYSMKIDPTWEEISSHWGEDPYFNLKFSYFGNLTLVGTHNTSGVILGKKPFSGQGLFKTIYVYFVSAFNTRIMNLQPTQSGYLKCDGIQTSRMVEPDDFYRITFDSIYYQGINEIEAIWEYLESIDHAFLGAQYTIVSQTYNQLEAKVDSFWQQQIPQIDLTNICIKI